MKKYRFTAIAAVLVIMLAIAGSALASAAPGDPMAMPAPVDNTPKGYVWAAVAVCIAIILPGIGSALGVGMAGRAAAGVSAEDPEKAGSCLVFELLPATQGLYGFVIAIFIAVGCGILNANVSFIDLPTSAGLAFFYASLPIGIVGLVSAYFQSRVCCAGIGIVAKQGNGGMGITFAIMVELYAILALIISILMVVNVPVAA